MTKTTLKTEKGPTRAREGSPKMAVVYVRVSTEDQVSGTSLTSQESDCRAWCSKAGYDIAALRTDAGESAKTADRKGLIAALEDARRLKADALVVHKLDRLSRNASDGLTIRAALRRHGCELVSISEPAGNDPVGDMVSTIMFAVAQFDNDIRAQRSKRGMAETAMRGGWITTPPCGFLAARSGSLPVLVPDPQKAPAIATALRALANGVADKSMTLLALRAAGMPSQSASRCLRQPVYGGLIRSSLTGGADVLAAFPGLVTPAEWYRIEAALESPQKKAPGANDGFPLVGCLKCPECGGSITGSASRNRHGKLYGYYACHEGHVRARSEVVHADLHRLLTASSQLSIFLNLIVRRVVKKIAAGAADAAKERSRHQAEATKAESRMAKLTAGWADGLIEDDQYRAQMAKLRRDHATAKEAAEEQPGSVDLATLMGKVETHMKNVPALWETLDLQGKKAFFSALFGAIELLPDGKLSNPSQTSIFAMVYDLSDSDIEDWCAWRGKVQTLTAALNVLASLLPAA